jgi:hypothetical protein
MLLLLLLLVVVTRGDPHPHVSSVEGDSGSTESFPLRSGQHKELDAGFYELALVAGTVFVDDNADGVLQSGEAERVAGMRVSLLAAESSERLLRSTVTDAEGNYGFFGVDLGEARVAFDVAAGWRVPPRPLGVPFRRKHSSADANGRSLAFRLVSGAKRVDVDLAVFRSLAGVGKAIVVFEDRNADSLRDAAAEPPIGNVSVALFSALDHAEPVAVTRTGALGTFEFADVKPGAYWFAVSLPRGAVWSPALAAARSDASIVDANGNTPRFAVDARHMPPPSVVGAYWPVAVRACLFEDGDGDNERAADDRGVSGVRAVLLRDGAEVARAVTAGAESCAEFDGVPPGRYAVRFQPAHCERCRYSAARWSVNGAPADGEHVVLASRDRAALVQGIFKPPHVRGTVFIDRMSTGVHDSGAVGVPGVLVRLLLASSKQLVASTHTDADGHFVFSDFAFDGFFVKFERPDGFLFSSNAGALAAAADGVESASACAPESGATRTFSSRSSTETRLVCGVFRAASLAVHFFVDADADGRQQSPSAEPDVGGVQAILRKAHDTAFEQRCVTASGGVCTFDSLEPDDYFVEGTKPPARSEGEKPFLFSHAQQAVWFLRVTLQRAVTAAAVGGLQAPRLVALARSVAAQLGLHDDDVAVIRNVEVKSGWQCDLLVPPSSEQRAGLYASALGGDASAVEWVQGGVDLAALRVSTFSERSLSGVLHLVSGEARSVAGGLFQLASVGGIVWRDVNGNGIFDSGAGDCAAAADGTCVEEQMAPNTGVELRRGSVVVARTTTDDAGRFDFVDLVPANNYALHFDKCAACKFSPTVGSAQ